MNEIEIIKNISKNLKYYHSIDGRDSKTGKLKLSKTAFKVYKLDESEKEKLRNFMKIPEKIISLKRTSISEEKEFFYFTRRELYAAQWLKKYRNVSITTDPNKASAILYSELSDRLMGIIETFTNPTSSKIFVDKEGRCITPSGFIRKSDGLKRETHNMHILSSEEVRFLHLMKRILSNKVKIISDVSSGEVSEIDTDKFLRVYKMLISNQKDLVSLAASILLSVKINNSTKIPFLILSSICNDIISGNKVGLISGGIINTTEKCISSVYIGHESYIDFLSEEEEHEEIEYSDDEYSYGMIIQRQNCYTILLREIINGKFPGIKESEKLSAEINNVTCDSVKDSDLCAIASIIGTDNYYIRKILKDEMRRYFNIDL